MCGTFVEYSVYDGSNFCVKSSSGKSEKLEVNMGARQSWFYCHRGCFVFFFYGEGL